MAKPKKQLALMKPPKSKLPLPIKKEKKKKGKQSKTDGVFMFN